MVRLSADAFVQVDAGLFPFPLHGTLSDPLQSADLCEGEPAEELEVDEGGELWLNQGQFLHCVVDQSELPRVDWIFQVIERDHSDVIAATFFRAVAGPRVIDDEPSHHACSIGHEAS